MSSEKPNKEVVIFSNFLEFEGRKLTFRNKHLFDITDLISYVPFNDAANAWIVKRKQLTYKMAQQLILVKPVEVDVSMLQWYQQERIKGCFDLEKI